MNRTIRGVAGALLALALTLPVAAQENSVSNDDGQTQYDEGLALLKAGKPDEALAKFEHAALDGHGDAANELGKLYLNGNGVKQDVEFAIKCFSDSAELGSLRGATNLGISYKDGRGVEQDHKKAMELLTKAADRGIAVAQYQLAEMYAFYMGTEVTPETIKTNPAKAQELYAKAAEQGMPQAQYKVGYYYILGPDEDKHDPKLAIEWLRKAADSNDPQILADIGELLQDRDGPIYDAWGAVELLSVAAQAGNRDAQYYLGTMAYEGRGTKKDLATAVKLYNAAAAQGQAFACNALSVLYLNGEGVEKNPQRAYVFAEMAVDGGGSFDGSNFAKLTRIEAEGLMTPEQLAEAKAAVERNRAAKKAASK